MIFISAPYSSPDPTIVEYRVNMVAKYAASLFNLGLYPVSPILIGHSIATRAGGISVASADWEGYSRNMLLRCTELHILLLPGGAQSSGMAKELEIAVKVGMPVIKIGIVNEAFVEIL